MKPSTRSPFQHFSFLLLSRQSIGATADSQFLLLPFTGPQRAASGPAPSAVQQFKKWVTPVGDALRRNSKNQTSKFRKYPSSNLRGRQRKEALIKTNIGLGFDRDWFKPDLKCSFVADRLRIARRVPDCASPLALLPDK